MGVRDTNRCDATVSLNIQKFEEDKLEGRETGSGTGDPSVSWSLSYILVLLTKNVIIFESGLARLSRFWTPGSSKLLESQTDIC
jgi:hypothetical protein